MSTIAHLSDYRRREEEHDAARMVAEYEERVERMVAILNEMPAEQRIAAAEALLEAAWDGEALE